MGLILTSSSLQYIRRYCPSCSFVSPIGTTVGIPGMNVLSLSSAPHLLLFFFRLSDGQLVEMSLVYKTEMDKITFTKHSIFRAKIKSRNN